MLQRFIIICTLISFIGGLILSLLADNFIILGLAFLINFTALSVGYISSKLIFNEASAETEDLSNYHNAHSF